MIDFIVSEDCLSSSLEKASASGAVLRNSVADYVHPCPASKCAEEIPLKLLTRHLAERHCLNGDPPPNVRYFCPYSTISCNARGGPFQQLNQLITHYTSCHVNKTAAREQRKVSETPFMCETCQHTFNTRDALRIHCSRRSHLPAGGIGWKRRCRQKKPLENEHQTDRPLPAKILARPAQSSAPPVLVILVNTPSTSLSAAKCREASAQTDGFNDTQIYSSANMPTLQCNFQSQQCSDGRYRFNDELCLSLPVSTGRTAQEMRPSQQPLMLTAEAATYTNPTMVTCAEVQTVCAGFHAPRACANALLADMDDDNFFGAPYLASVQTQTANAVDIFDGYTQDMISVGTSFDVHHTGTQTIARELPASAPTRDDNDDIIRLLYHDSQSLTL